MQPAGAGWHSAAATRVSLQLYLPRVPLASKTTITDCLRHDKLGMHLANTLNQQASGCQWSSLNDWFSFKVDQQEWNISHLVTWSHASIWKTQPQNSCCAWRQPYSTPTHACCPACTTALHSPSNHPPWNAPAQRTCPATSTAPPTAAPLLCCYAAGSHPELHDLPCRALHELQAFAQAVTLPSHLLILIQQPP